MATRRKTGTQKTPAGVAGFISDQLTVLKNVASVLNGGLDADLPDAVIAEGVAVVEATLGSRYPVIPDAPAAAFDRLAKGQSLELVVAPNHGRLFRRGRPIRIGHQAPVYLCSTAEPRERGIMAVWLAVYLWHPHRERLRRCAQCARWFVDETRNKSARRCSRACTIAWSNSHRKEPPRRATSRRSGREGSRSSAPGISRA